jgi:Ca-activated chloride channel family protein
MSGRDTSTSFIRQFIALSTIWLWNRFCFKFAMKILNVFHFSQFIVARNSWVILLFCSVIFFSQSQNRIIENHRELGLVQTAEERVVDFEVKNQGNSAFYILSMQKGYAFDYKLSTDYILPDSSAWIRLQVKQSKPGKFNIEIPVYFSDKNQAEIITIKGEIDKSGAQELFASCPDFKQKPPAIIQQENVFTLNVNILDSETNLPVSNANIILIQNGRPIKQIKTDDAGNAIADIPLGITYFVVQKKNYTLTEVASYVNFKNSSVQIPIQPQTMSSIVDEAETKITKEERVIEITQTPQVQEEKNPSDLKSELQSWLLDRKEKVAQQDQYKDASNEIEEQYSNAKEEFDVKNEKQLMELPFTNDNFKSVNVVFVLDVSSSMRQYDRLSLMKYALLELTDMLRDDDQFGIVTFASNTDVLIPNKPIKNAERLEEQISQLKASGMTAGGEGIKLGFKQVRKNFIPDGHNMVVIITDGGFNKNSGNYQKWIKQNRKRGIYLSVVGIKNNEKSRINLMEAAELGSGEYLEIQNIADAAENLNLAIRKLSYKN